MSLNMDEANFEAACPVCNSFPCMGNCPENDWEEERLLGIEARYEWEMQQADPFRAVCASLTPVWMRTARSFINGDMDCRIPSFEDNIVFPF